MGDHPERIWPFRAPDIFARGVWTEGVDKGPEYVRADLYDALRAQVEALQDRLEMRHAFDGSGKRISVEPGSIPDGISCRDETIRQLDKRVDGYRAHGEAMRTDISTAHRQIVEGKRTCARDTLSAALTKSTGSPHGQQ